jgi:hypothetical protein
MTLPVGIPSRHGTKESCGKHKTHNESIVTTATGTFGSAASAPCLDGGGGTVNGVDMGLPPRITFCWRGRPADIAIVVVGGPIRILQYFYSTAFEQGYPCGPMLHSQHVQVAQGKQYPQQIFHIYQQQQVSYFSFVLLQQIVWFHFLSKIAASCGCGVVESSAAKDNVSLVEIEQTYCGATSGCGSKKIDRRPKNGCERHISLLIDKRRRVKVVLRPRELRETTTKRFWNDFVYFYSQKSLS